MYVSMWMGRAWQGWRGVKARVPQSAGSTRDVNIAARLTSQEQGVLSCHYSSSSKAHRLTSPLTLSITSAFKKKERKKVKKKKKKKKASVLLRCGTCVDVDWWSLSWVWGAGTVMGGCVGRSRMDGQGSARSSTRSKKRGGKRLGKLGIFFFYFFFYRSIREDVI